jgi:DUF4097 and DUF4098 domain-containing protein YvlB
MIPSMPISKPLLLAGLMAMAAWPLLADQIATQEIQRSAPLDFDGVFTIENPAGRVTVSGTDAPRLDVHVIKRVRAADDASLREGMELTQLFIGGDHKNRLLKTVYATPSSRAWSSSVDYEIQVPRTVHVFVYNTMTEGIRVTNIRGNVLVKNVSGPIVINGSSGPINVDTVNGKVTVVYGNAPRGNAHLFSVNGQVEVRVPHGAVFDWTAETLQGDVMSTFPVHTIPGSQKSGKIMRASINGSQGPHGPVLQTTSVTGRVILMRNGESVESARSLIAQQDPFVQVSEDIRTLMQNLVGPVLLEQPTASRFVVQRNMLDGDFQFKTDLGNVFVSEIRGDAKVTTQAGEITLGTVSGTCDAISFGGPVNLGDISGFLNARTTAGNVSVRAARKGGTLWTDGGNVQLFYSGGPVTLHSGGGNVTLRQAGGDVHAEAHSGDVSVAFDPTLKSARADLRAFGGSVMLRIPPQLGADIDATVMTSSDEANRIASDFPGFSIVKEHVGARTKIHAVGKINGGGERIELRAENGDIQIRWASPQRIVSIKQR